MDFDALRSYCLSKKGTSEDLPFGPDTLVFRVGKKIFALVPLDEKTLRVNLKKAILTTMKSCANSFPA